MEQQQNNEQKFEVMATKVDPQSAVVINTICETLGTNVYTLLQHFLYTMIRMASDDHSVSPDIQKLMKIFDTPGPWANAINVCAPGSRRSISQVILIMEEQGKQGFAMTMLNKPFCGDITQTDNVNKIVERTIEVGMYGLYKDIRLMKAEMETNNISDLLLKMLDDQQRLNVTEEERQEMAGVAMYNEYGRRLEYGKKTKRFKHRTPDSLAPDRNRILFDDFDREAADYEVGETEGESHADRGDMPLGDIKPFTEEP